MKKIIYISITFFICSCSTHAPLGNPDATTAQAAMDQVEQLKEIAKQLTRIANYLETKK